MKAVTEMAVEKFLSGYNCAQAVLYAHSASLGLDTETALKVATGFGGGIAAQGETCGAVTGGIMALGLKYGRGARQDRSIADVAYQKTRDLMAAFEQAHGSCCCRTLLGGCDLRTPQGRQQFKDQDLHHKTCGRCVQTVGEILAGMLEAPATQNSTESQ
jgi:C_GCAxxG_C_C family probable redox protein